MRARACVVAVALIAGCRCARETVPPPPGPPTAPASSAPSSDAALPSAIVWHLAARARTRLFDPFGVSVLDDGHVLVAQGARVALLEGAGLSRVANVPETWERVRGVVGRWPDAATVVAVSPFATNGYAQSSARWTGSSWSPVVNMERHENGNLADVIAWGGVPLALVGELVRQEWVTELRPVSPSTSSAPSIPKDEDVSHAAVASSGALLALGSPWHAPSFFLRTYAPGDLLGKRAELAGLEACEGQSFLATRGARIAVVVRCQKEWEATWFDGSTWMKLPLPDYAGPTSITSLAMTDDAAYLAVDGTPWRWDGAAWTQAPAPGECVVTNLWSSGALFADCVHESDARLYTTLPIDAPLDFDADAGTTP
jgi:hypothetical protein